MDVSALQTVKQLCSRYGIYPSKKYGQNFLIADWVAEKMCQAAELTKEDRVVEIGPGLGALTRELTERAGQVLAVEIDQKLYEAAKEQLESYQNVEIINGDILKIDNERLVELLHNSPQPSLNLREGDRSEPPLKIRGARGVMKPYKLVASLPYSITSAALRKFTEEEPRPSLIVVLVQKEVAQRVCAKPSPRPSPKGRGGGGNMSILSVAVQFYGKPEIVAKVPRGCFWPQPKVESAILRIEFTDVSSQFTAVETKRLFEVVRAGFSGKRKQLQNNLLRGLHISRQRALTSLSKVGIDPKIRAQDLAVEDWIALARII